MTVNLAMQSCGVPERKESSPAVNDRILERFHADNDIAMTIRSLADAIRVGEPLDSLDYDFQGILTDGQGMPLYTDVQGEPGEWMVDVEDATSVTIRNIQLGDLLPGDLQNYILSSLRVSDEAKVQYMPPLAIDDDETEVSVYDISGGYLRFDVRSGFAPNGLEGAYLTIRLSVTPPSGAEKQTAV